MTVGGRQLRVLVLPMREFGAVLRGEARIANLPSNGEVQAVWADARGRNVGLRVFCPAYRAVPHGDPLPVFPAVVACALDLVGA